MGNLFSRRNRVKPVSIRSAKSPSNSLQERVTLINKRIAVIQPENTIPQNTGATANADTSMQIQNVPLAVEDNTRESCIQHDFTIPRDQLISGKKLELAGQKEPLPDIGQQIEKCIARRKVKRNTYGQTTSVSFDVNLDDGTSKRSENGVSKMPRRLRRIPEIMHEVVQARLTEAVNREENDLGWGLQDSRTNQILSKAMLNRLEEEKQREIRWRCEEKQRKAARMKEKIKTKQEEKIRLSNVKQKTVKDNIAQQEKQTSSAIEWKILEKIRTADQRKAEMKQRAREKQELLRLRRMRAQLKSRGNIKEETNILRDKMEDEMLRGENEDNGICSLDRKIHFKRMKAMGNRENSSKDVEGFPINDIDTTSRDTPQGAEKNDKDLSPDHNGIDDGAFGGIA